MRIRRTLSAAVGLAAALAVAVPLCADDYSKILSYTFGQSRTALSSIEAAIRKASPAEAKAIETKLLAALSDAKATFECKQFICRMLRRIGTEQSVAPLAALLTDEKLSHMARFALQRMPSGQVDAVLREALGKVAPKLQIGIVSSIADRRDRKAVAALGTLASSPNADLAGAALAALGRIGGTDAAAAIDAVTVPKALQATKADAQLMCADTLLGEGKTAAAAAIYKKLGSADNPKMVRVAAFQGLVRTDPAGMMPKVMEMLKSQDVHLQRAASRIITTAPGAGVTKAVAAQIAEMSDQGKVVLLTALATRADTAAAPAVAKALASSNEAVRIAAIRTLAVIGDATCVAPLTTAAAGGGNTGKAAVNALSRLTGDGVDQAIITCFTGGASPARTALAKVAAMRQAAAVVPCLLARGTADKDAKTRQAVFEAIGALAGQKDLPKIVALLVANTSSTERATLEQALAVSAGRVKDTDARVAPIVARLPQAGAAKGNLMNVLARLGGDKARRAVEGQLGAGAEIRKGAIRALAAWGDPGPIETLMGVARGDSSAVNQVLALRGVIRLVALDSSRGEGRTAEILGQAMKLAKRPDEKRAILAALPRCQAALAIAQGCCQDAAVKAEAELAVRKIKLGILRKSMKANASRNAKAAAAVLDGKRDTYWASGRGQNRGDWFTVDMGSAQTIRIVTLDSGARTGDFGRTVELYVSNDGKNWGKRLARANGAAITKIDLTKGVSARYIRITQTSRARNQWAIAELYVE